MKRIWRVLTRRRTVTWVGIFAVVIATFIALTRDLSPNAVVKPALSWLIALVAWALAVLFWDLAIVWIEYVSQSRHLDYLKKVWGVAGPVEGRPEVDARNRDRIWWLRNR